MNNENVEKIVQGVGVMVELWCIVNNNFISQGMTKEDALAHTSAFMEIMLGNMMGTVNDKED